MPPQPNVEVIPGGICPGCIFRIPKIPPYVDKNKKYAVIIGIRPKFPKGKKFDEIWCVGNCGIKEGHRIAKQFPNMKDKMKMIKGCPPLDWYAENTIKKELRKRGWL